MNLLTWNLNHRAARRRIKPWVIEAIAAESPDAVVLTEYVQGIDDAPFRAILGRLGFNNNSISERPRRQNKVMILTKSIHERIPLPDPDIHASVPSNILQVRTSEGLNIVGFRMPAYERKDAHCKPTTWEWLIDVVDKLKAEPTVIAGDFNTAVGDSDAYCGNKLQALIDRGWNHLAPDSGHSWRRAGGVERAIDHVFVSNHLAKGATARYSWDFQNDNAEASKAVVGSPDHAMVIADFPWREGQ